MEATIGAVWNAQANNPYYRITELVLPASSSTGLQRLEFQTIFLPHTAGRLRLKCEGQHRDIEIVAGQPIRFESGIECEMLNTNEGTELRFTVMESK